MSSQAIDVVSEADRLFANNSIDQVATFCERTRLDIKQTQEELRGLVGEKYRELLESCDLVVGMSDTCSEIEMQWESLKKEQQDPKRRRRMSQTQGVGSRGGQRTNNTTDAAEEERLVQQKLLSSIEALQTDTHRAAVLLHQNRFAEGAAMLRTVSTNAVDLEEAAGVVDDGSRILSASSGDAALIQRLKDARRAIEPLQKELPLAVANALRSLCAEHSATKPMTGADAVDSASAIVDRYDDIFLAYEHYHSLSRQATMDRLADIHCEVAAALMGESSTDTAFNRLVQLLLNFLYFLSTMRGRSSSVLDDPLSRGGGIPAGEPRNLDDLLALDPSSDPAYLTKVFMTVCGHGALTTAASGNSAASAKSALDGWVSPITHQQAALQNETGAELLDTILTLSKTLLDSKTVNGGSSADLAAAARLEKVLLDRIHSTRSLIDSADETTCGMLDRFSASISSIFSEAVSAAVDRQATEAKTSALEFADLIRNAQGKSSKPADAFTSPSRLPSNNTAAASNYSLAAVQKAVAQRVKDKYGRKKHQQEHEALMAVMMKSQPSFDDSMSNPSHLSSPNTMNTRKQSEEDSGVSTAEALDRTISVIRTFRQSAIVALKREKACRESNAKKNKVSSSTGTLSRHILGLCKEFVSTIKAAAVKVQLFSTTKSDAMKITAVDLVHLALLLLSVNRDVSTVLQHCEGSSSAGGFSQQQGTEETALKKLIEEQHQLAVDLHSTWIKDQHALFGEHLQRSTFALMTGGSNQQQQNARRGGVNQEELQRKRLIRHLQFFAESTCDLWTSATLSSSSEETTESGSSPPRESATSLAFPKAASPFLVKAMLDSQETIARAYRSGTGHTLPRDVASELRALFLRDVSLATQEGLDFIQRTLGEGTAAASEYETATERVLLQALFNLAFGCGLLMDLPPSALVEGSTTSSSSNDNALLSSNSIQKVLQGDVSRALSSITDRVDVVNWSVVKPFLVKSLTTAIERGALLAGSGGESGSGAAAQSAKAAFTTSSTASTLQMLPEIDRITMLPISTPSSVAKSSSLVHSGGFGMGASSPARGDNSDANASGTGGAPGGAESSTSVNNMMRGFRSMMNW